MDDVTIAAVCFDLYETLVSEFDPDWAPSEGIGARLGMGDAAFNAAWLARHERRMRGGFPDYAAVLRDICGGWPAAPDEALIARLVAERLAAKALPFARLEGPIVEMLEGVRHLGLRVGVISNCAPEEVAAWGACRLAALVDVAVFSYDVGHAKPEATIYRLACDRLGVAPGQAVFIGDGGSDELAGAARAGLRPYRATWFLDRWPAWRRARDVAAGHDHWTETRSPAEVVALLTSGRAPSALR